VNVESPGNYTFEIEGARGCAWITGQGEPIVLVASMLVLARSYDWLVKELEGFRVILLEMPGSGGGSRLRPAWSFEHYADWLGKFLNATGLQDATVVGHSNSGAVVLLAAERGLVRRAIVVGSVGARKASLPRVLAGRAVDAVLEWRLTFWGFHHVLINLLRHTRNFWNQVQLSARSDVTAAASQIRVPILLAWGGRDHTVGTSGQEHLATIIPNVETYVCPSGSHDWLLTHPQEFAKVLSTFVPNRQRANL
jgi:pimeloyl-ACP methyl ester carboxylesterase